MNGRTARQSDVAVLIGRLMYDLNYMRMPFCVRTTAIAMFFSSVVCAQTTDDLLRAMYIREAVTAVPNYTRSETIDRELMRPPWHTFQRLDLVRLEVEKADGKDAWLRGGQIRRQTGSPILWAAD